MTPPQDAQMQERFDSLETKVDSLGTRVESLEGKVDTLDSKDPNLVALELSSFKCGHDALIYSIIESIIEQSRTPYFSFKDIDENKPAGSIRIRVETIHYFLKRYTEDLKRRKQTPVDTDAHLAEYERQIREQLLLEPELAEVARAQQANGPKGRLLPMLGAELHHPHANA